MVIPTGSHGVMDLDAYLTKAVNAVRKWESRWGSLQVHPSVAVGEDAFAEAFDAYLSRLEGNYPFFHPRYAGQMLKPPHPVAVAGYTAAMLINPNNHALDGGPPTSEMEKEVVVDLTAMFGFPEESLGHLTSSGTIANLEAAWIAREMHPEKGIAYSEQAHYTHGRVGDVLRVETTAVPTATDGRIDLDALEEVVRSGEVGTVVLTAGTTGIGAVDPVADAVSLCRQHGVRVHVDAAYGGFFVLLSGDPDAPLSEETRRHLRAISQCDSVVVDPHKHGLQPYGCGCILFRDPRVGRVYQHDSPYTYFTSEALHLGEISFECSRAGAAAGALWLTLAMLPLKSDAGLGPILKAGLLAARDFYRRLDESTDFTAWVEPELDIVSYFPIPTSATTASIEARSRTVFETAMQRRENPLFLSLVRVDAAHVTERWPQIQHDRNTTSILRSVLMKPEHEDYVEVLFNGLTEVLDQ